VDSSNAPSAGIGTTLEKTLLGKKSVRNSAIACTSSTNRRLDPGELRRVGI